MMDYCNKVKGFIDYTLSNLKNIIGGGIRYPCKRCRNKRFLNPDSSIKRAHEIFFVLVCTWRTLYSLQDHGRKDS